MYCQNCGAQNEAGAHFCVECGTPLESEAVVSPPPLAEDDSDRTILTTAPRVAEDAKTVSINQAELAAAEIEVEPPPVIPPPPEAGPAVPPPVSAGKNAGRPVQGSGSGRSRNYLIIAIVVLIVLCCCCTTLAVFGAASSDVINEIMYELSLLDLSQPFV